jgi:hypothetical protein
VDASVDEDWEIIWLRAALWRLAAGELQIYPTEIKLTKKSE